MQFFLTASQKLSARAKMCPTGQEYPAMSVFKVKRCYF